MRRRPERCDACGRALLWARTRRGCWIRLDAQAYPDGNVLVERVPNDAPRATVFPRRMRITPVADAQSVHRAHRAACPAARWPR